MPQISSQQPVARSGPRELIRIESVIILAAAIWAYAQFDFGWGMFAALFLLPDIGMVGYIINTRFGSVLYNAVHTYAVPVVLLAAGFALALPVVQQIALIWVAHIAFDRVLGYGLKYGDTFKNTHLGKI